ncbi:Mpo1-like protein [Sneathiella glossodoripedis]|uniref:Mpo1-like protein n=1 Tax=Sneathiella glossodoripedis TaxID=418853 RepID=UPI00047049B7
MGRRISSYKEFWPYYLREHSKPECRALHYFGTTLSLIMLALFLVTLNTVFFLAALICGYGPAWIAHFFIEKNRPATFKYPLWSLISDFRMYFMWIRGNLGRELRSNAIRE